MGTIYIIGFVITALVSIGSYINIYRVYKGKKSLPWPFKQEGTENAVVIMGRLVNEIKNTANNWWKFVFGSVLFTTIIFISLLWPAFWIFHFFGIGKKITVIVKK